MKFTIRVPSGRRRGVVLTTRSPRALVIDDDRYVLSLLCDLLGSWGYDVDGVNSPAEGIRRFQAAPYDVIVTDLTMPGSAGSTWSRASATETHGGGDPVHRLHR